ncbi:MAG: hypothetical protein JW888_12185 [Pirellulales bacterium]|nr:hypothetical protein [Pirellulales bacterium]
MRNRRSGLASLDYVLVLGVVIPLIAFIIVVGKDIMRSVYEMAAVLLSWPFM